jgi:hypothetical protein
MPEPIRVRDDKTGAEYSTYAVDENGNTDEGLTVLDEPAVDGRGDLLPPKYPAAAEAPAAAPKPKPTPSRPANTEEH